MGFWRILFSFGILSQLTITVNGDANVTIQLLTYSNPTFGLAANSYYCAYLSPNVPPPPNARGTLPVFQGQRQNGFASGQNGGFASGQNQPQRPSQFQNQQQYQQYMQSQQNQQYQQGQQQQQQYRQNGQLPYNAGIPNQQQFQQQLQYQRQQQQQNPQYQPPQPQQQYQPPQQQYLQQQQQQPYQQQNYGQSTFPGQQQCVTNQRDFTVPNWNECKFSFATVFSTFGGEPLVITTGLIPLPSQNATIDFTQTTWNDKCTWGDCADRTWIVPRSQIFKIKPNVIELIVTHYGDSVWLSNGVYTSFGYDQANVVDTIPINIAGLVPAAASVSQPQVYTLCVNGDQQSTNGVPLSTLNLAISVQCKAGFYGQYCNLTNCTTYENNTQVCSSSVYAGHSLVCNYDNVNLQPINCTLCQYGVSNGRCNTLESLAKIEGGNTTGYIVGISILAILLAIAIAVIIIGACTYRSHDQPTNRRNQPQSSVATGWFGTKAPPKSTNGTRAGYAQAATEDESEWQQPRRQPAATHESQQQQAPPARPYNFPPPPGRPSSGSTPENASRREAAV